MYKVYGLTYNEFSQKIEEDFTIKTYPSRRQRYYTCEVKGSMFTARVYIKK